jgi:hypothetical protein
MESRSSVEMRFQRSKDEQLRRNVDLQRGTFGGSVMFGEETRVETKVDSPEVDFAIKTKSFSAMTRSCSSFLHSNHDLPTSLDPLRRKSLIATALNVTEHLHVASPSPYPLEGITR